MFNSNACGLRLQRSVLADNGVYISDAFSLRSACLWSSKNSWRCQQSCTPSGLYTRTLDNLADLGICSYTNHRVTSTFTPECAHPCCPSVNRTPGVNCIYTSEIISDVISYVCSELLLSGNRRRRHEPQTRQGDLPSTFCHDLQRFFGMGGRLWVARVFVDFIRIHRRFVKSLEKVASALLNVVLGLCLFRSCSLAVLVKFM